VRERERKGGFDSHESERDVINDEKEREREREEEEEKIENKLFRERNEDGDVREREREDEKEREREKDEDEYDVDVEVVNRILNKLQGKALAYNGFAYKENRESTGVDGTGRGDICTLEIARAFVVNLESLREREQSVPAICIELVGNRFLRRMVRVLVATVIREAVMRERERDEDVLLKICDTRTRDRASYSLSGVGLCLCGVGYDINDLSIDRFIATNPKKIRKNQMKKEREKEREREREREEMGKK